MDYSIVPPSIEADPEWVAGSFRASNNVNNTGLHEMGERYTFDQGGFHLMLYQIIVPVIFSTIIVVGTTGNSLVIYVILSREYLRSVTNFLLLNLAFSDICFLLICGVFSTIYYALAVWPFGDILCRIIQYLLYVTCYVTVYTLVAISIVRYLMVVHGNKSCFVKHKRNVLLLIALTWLTFLLAKIPILIVHGVSTNKYTQRTECIISGRTEAQQLFATFFVFAYALPLTIIAIMYVLLLFDLRRQEATILNNHQSEDRTRHVTRIVIIVVVVFAVGWLPLHVHLLISYYGKPPESPVYQVLLIVWHILMFLGSIINPIIYNYFSKDFRSAFAEAVFCRKTVPITQV